MSNNNTFTATNSLVYFVYLLQRYHLTGEQIENLIEEAQKVDRHNPARIVPYTAGLHAINLTNELMNRKGNANT